jgi:hypothetical protein
MLTNFDKMKEYFELGEKNNWDRSKISENKSIFSTEFKKHAQEYIKQNNIKPTTEMIFCLLPVTYYKKEIIELMVEEDSVSSDLGQIQHDYCKFCLILKKQRGIEYCKEKNISWEEVEKNAEIYERKFIKVSDFPEEQLMEICYDICEKNNWNNQEMSLKRKAN